MGYDAFMSAVKAVLDAEGFPYRQIDLEHYVNWFWNNYPKDVQVMSCVDMFKNKIKWEEGEAQSAASRARGDREWNKAWERWTYLTEDDGN